MARPSFKRHRFPPEIIQHAAWLYFRFTLSFRDVEELLAQRGIGVSYETVRYWAMSCLISRAAATGNSRATLPLVPSLRGREVGAHNCRSSFKLGEARKA